MAESEYLNVRQLAERLGRHVNTIRYRVRLMKHQPERDLLPWPPSVDPVLGSPRWRMAQVQAWLGKCLKQYGMVP